jgi:Na+-transporting NADH:ubiquinone oxidoreductase subunit NqrD
MFVMLLGLINAEKAQKLLMEDIDDQKEMEDYYYYPAINNKGETLDIVRLNSATKLASSTILKLTIGTAIATVYLLVCLGLFAGVIKNRSHFIVPWMVFDVIVSLAINSVLVIIGASMLYEKFGISEWLYCKSRTSLLPENPRVRH